MIFVERVIFEMFYCIHLVMAIIFEFFMNETSSFQDMLVNNPINFDIFYIFFLNSGYFVFLAKNSYLVEILF